MDTTLNTDTNTETVTKIMCRTNHPHYNTNHYTIQPRLAHSTPQYTTVHIYYMERETGEVESQSTNGEVHQ